MIQRHALAVGETGCYFLSILKLAEFYIGDTIDPIRAYEACMKKGWIDEECFVENAGAIMTAYAGGRWTARHDVMEYVPTGTELEIIRYEWKKTMATLSHFVVGDGSGCLGWDPYGNSETVRNGVPVSKRIFRRVA